MTINIRAVYEGGVLRPMGPLGLPEDETVDVTIATHARAPATAPVSDEEIIRRLKSAKTIVEWVEATKLLSSDDGAFDIVEALNENRLWSGEHPLIPQPNSRLV